VRRLVFREKAAALKGARSRLALLNLSPNEAARHGITINRDGIRRSALELIALPGVDFGKLAGIWPELTTLAPEIAEQLEIDALYAGYLDRQEADVVAFRKDEALALPEGLDYARIRGLSSEAIQKLGRIRPATLGQAARIDGVTPAALTLVLAHVRSLAA